ncbi:MAG: Ig-like domain-containing protein [Bacteroidales bacterium]|nr:Ig-like domain-containing protein [Bacteroidales bacterium]
MKRIILLFIFTFFSIAGYVYAQTGNSCSDAVDFGNINGPAQSASIESDGEYWFSLTLSEGVDYMIFSLCGNAEFDTKMEIWADCNDGTYLDYNDDGENCDDNESEISLSELAAGTYYIKIYGYDSYDYGNFSLSITSIEGNDNTCETAADYGSINGAPHSASILPDGEYWCYVTLNNNMENVLFSLCGNAEFDTKMEIWADCNDYTYLDYNDDGENCDYSESEIFLYELAAGTYYIKIYGYNSDDFGNFSLSITSIEGDDNTCETAADYGSINGAPHFASILPDGEYWCYITLNNNMEDVSFSLCGNAEFDTQMEIWNSCNADTYLYYNDDGENCDDYESEIFLDELAAGTYYIKIYGYDEYYYGSFSLSITGTEATQGISVNSYFPEIDEPNVAIDANVAVLFNSDITEGANFGEITITYDDSQTLGNVSAIAEGTLLTIMHDNFDYGTIYTVTIPSGALTGQSEDISWSFTTVEELEISIVSRTPDIDAVDVAVDALVSVTFSDDITLNDDSEVYILKLPGNEAVNITNVTVENGNTLAIYHDNFEYEYTYTITIANTTINDFSNSITWSFTTEDTPATSPEIVSITPEENRSALPDAEVKVTFNMNISGNNLNTISISPDPGGVSASINGAELTIAHDNFNDGPELTTYTVRIPGGVIANYSEDISWSFYTGQVGTLENHINEVNIYPNPSSGSVFIMVSENSEVEIFDATGRIIETHNVNTNSTISFTQPAGIYFVKVYAGNNVSTHKVIIQ